MQMLDSNSYYLNQYLHNTDLLEDDWNTSKSDKRDQCIELARKILLQDVDTYTFEVAFGRYINDSEDKYDWMISVLEDIENGVCDDQLKDAFILEALDSAAYCLFDCELEELLEDDVSYSSQLYELVDEVGL